MGAWIRCNLPVNIYETCLEHDLYMEVKTFLVLLSKVRTGCKTFIHDIDKQGLKTPNFFMEGSLHGTYKGWALGKMDISFPSLHRQR